MTKIRRLMKMEFQNEDLDISIQSLVDSSKLNFDELIKGLLSHEI